MIKYEVRVYTDGTKSWYLNGNLHNEHGPAIEYANGDKHWFLNDKRHNEHGPAVEWPDGTKSWYLNDKRHNEHGPAIECASGTKWWYLDGKELTEAEFNAHNNPVKELTVADIEKLVGHPVKIVKD